VPGVADRPQSREINIRLARRNDRFGSIATEIGFPRHVRFPPVSDRTADIEGGPGRANKRLMHRSNLTVYSIISSARASSARGAPGVNFCNPIKIDETRFIHLVAGFLNLRELELSSVSQMIASNFRDHGDVHNHPCRKRLDRL
jgi:hypothetical protein